MLRNDRFFYANTLRNTYARHVAAPMLRYAFPGEEGTATLQVSGLGFYRLFLNGEDITRGRLAPYISNPDHYIYYDEYDLTPLLRKGENVLGLMLGNGMQNCDMPYWNYNRTVFRSAPKFALSFILDGEERFDGQVFRWAPSPYYYDDLRSGVFYDARVLPAGWCSPGFDDSTWQPVTAAEPMRGTFRKKGSPDVTIYDEIAPVLVKESALNPDYTDDHQHDLGGPYAESKMRKDKGFLYDFGLNTAAVYRLRIKGRKGQKISLQFCELLDKQGRPHYNNVNFYPDGYAQRDIYICRGGGAEEEFVPDFTYHGFRYCFVTGITREQAETGLLTMLPISCATETLGEFSCSDPVLNALQAMAVNSDRSNYIHIFTDCPQREKMGWTGDTAVSAEQMILNLDVLSGWREWLSNIRKAQRETGAIPCVVPTDSWGYGWGSGPIWDNILFELPYIAYQYRGDLSLARESATAMLLYLQFASEKVESDGLVEYGLGDWVQADVRKLDRPGCSEPKAPRRFVDSCALYDACRKAESLFGALNKPRAQAFAASLAEDLLSALRRRCIDHGTATAWGSCQTSQAIAIALGIFTPAQLPAAGDRLEELVHAAGDGIDCGFYGLRYLLHALSMTGRHGLAYHLITRPEYPSYRWFYDQGETAVPENFRIRKIDSRNHHFLCDFSHWFYRWVGGIHVNPHGDDVNYVEIRPWFCGALTHARASYRLPGGVIEVEWRRNADDSVSLRVNADPRLFVRFFAPEGYEVDCPEDARMDGMRTLGNFPPVTLRRLR